MVEGIEALERPQTLKSSGALSTDEPLVRSFAFLYEAPISPNVINTMKPSDETLNKVHYAGFFRRVAAFLIDAIIMTTIGVVGGGLIGLLYALSLIIATAGNVAPSSIGIEAGVLGVIWGVVADWLYSTIMESSSKQATLGKMVLNIIVTNYNLSKISFAQANARYWGKFVSTFIFCSGFLMAALTEKKQALHDQLAGTLVIVNRR